MFLLCFKDFLLNLSVLATLHDCLISRASKWILFNTVELNQIQQYHESFKLL